MDVTPTIRGMIYLLSLIITMFPDNIFPEYFLFLRLSKETILVLW